MEEISQFQIFQSSDGRVQLSVSLEHETVWLTQAQMMALFERDQSVISRHVNNVFKEGELERESNMQKMHIANSDKPVAFYSLDVIISVGYRVKSQRGVQFRQWATRVLKEHLVQGYTLNQQRLQERGIEFEQAVQLLSQTLANQQLVSENGAAVLAVVRDYARSWSLLQGYDEQSLTDQTLKQADMQSLDLDRSLSAIAELKRTLINKGEATALCLKQAEVLSATWSS
ncbi:MAG: virulence RhuM family protein [Pseudomonadales bacterium]|nr:virulence RhuM family protein [Pseudomonadales bacterium]